MKKSESGLMIPKKTHKKRRKKHAQSIVNTKCGVCFLCALEGDRSRKVTEVHHVLFGSGLRSISEAEGLKVDLCIPHHRIGPEAVHNSRETRERLCRIFQKEYEKTHTREEWMGISGKNYL